MHFELYFLLLEVPGFLVDPRFRQIPLTPERSLMPVYRCHISVAYFVVKTAPLLVLALERNL